MGVSKAVLPFHVSKAVLPFHVSLFHWPTIPPQFVPSAYHFTSICSTGRPFHLSLFHWPTIPPQFVPLAYCSTSVCSTGLPFHLSLFHWPTVPPQFVPMAYRSTSVCSTGLPFHLCSLGLSLHLSFFPLTYHSTWVLLLIQVPTKRPHQNRYLIAQTAAKDTQKSTNRTKGSIRTTFDTNQSKRGAQLNTSGEEKYLLGFQRGSDECIRQIRTNKEEREAISKKEGRMG